MGDAAGYTGTVPTQSRTPRRTILLGSLTVQKLTSTLTVQKLTSARQLRTHTAALIHPTALALLVPGSTKCPHPLT